MKLSMLLFLVTLILMGCGGLSKFWANTTGYDEVCVDNVKYLQFPSGVTVKYNSIHMHIERCKE